MRYMVCQNNQSTSKYFKGRYCYEEVLVDANTKSVLCWKCTSSLVPPPEEKKTNGYPRGWKFMTEFVDKDGNVYRKGEIQSDLFGTLPPTEIKENTIKERKKKETIDDKITTEYSKMVQAVKRKTNTKSVRSVSKTKRRK